VGTIHSELVSHGGRAISSHSNRQLTTRAVY